ncbi:MAG: bifunctional diaminohydroxyphosphoribosylaminopyrimidine deaminase/5-amino-6-(5-phosphoribosylamino)uracil reductase RibD [Verrucomicrobiota bacterium]
MTDEAAMQLALVEARRGIGLTSPNPPVGAVILGPGGEVLGSGWHRQAGGPHAEIEALRAAAAAGHNTAGAAVFITLEPCSTHGRTPPCVEALIAAKPARVVWGAQDPNPAHLGRAELLLKNSGISVTTGVCGRECAEILQPFSKRIRTGLPWVVAKAGMSLDGKITRPLGEGQWITSAEARLDAMSLRLHADAILVGAETVRADNPSLTLRGIEIPSGKCQPWRCVLTRSGNLPSNSTIFTDSHQQRTIVFPNIPLDAVLRDLARRGVMSVLIEGGGQLLASAFSAGLVDEVIFYVAPLISGNGLPVVNERMFAGSSVALEFRNFQQTGPDLRIQARIRKEDSP